MNKLATCTLLMWSFFCFAQNGHSLYAKANLLLAPVGVLNAGLEYQIAPKYTVQGDFLISPWKSFAGSHAQIYMTTIEGRYYFKEAFNKFYIGANVGVAAFDLTKSQYAGTHNFQRGFNYLLGATVGYQLQLKEKWNLDFFAGGGTVQSYYHGYQDVAPKWIRTDDAEKWNKSGEFLPFRGGVMLSYKIN